MTVYHVEIKSGRNVFHFVSGDISEKAMFRWAYEEMERNYYTSLTIYYPTQRVGGTFKLYNELGKVRNSNGAVRFYPSNSDNRSFPITPYGDLVVKESKARRA